MLVLAAPRIRNVYEEKQFLAAFVTILMMVAPSKMSAQEENGFKKFSVEEGFADNGFQWFRDAQLLAAGNKEKSNAMTIGMPLLSTRKALRVMYPNRCMPTSQLASTLCISVRLLMLGRNDGTARAE